jgi:hypothetical protein
MAVLVVVEAVVVALLALLVASLLRSHAEILRALHELGVGTDPSARSAPQALAMSSARGTGADVQGTTPGGEAVAVGVVGAPQSTLLAFLSSGCITCHRFWEGFADPRLDVPGGARLVIVTMGGESESRSRIAEIAPASQTVIMSSQAWEDYDVPGSPYFAYVDGSTGAIVGGGTATDWANVRDMIEQAADDGALRDGSEHRAARARRARARHLAQDAREARADDALRAAGIEPGDPSLYAAGRSEEPPVR